MDQKKNALLVTYYWPPAGGPGVHRWLRFSSFFPENDVQLTVFCPDDAAWPIVDEQLQKQVHPALTILRKKVFEPHKYLGKKNNPNVGGGLTASKKQSFIQKAIIWIRGNLFIPDARVFWIRPSVRFLHAYLKSHPEIDTIITTGPPHSLHVIGRNLKRKNQRIKWVADFRDPWTEIDFYQELLPGAWADKRQKAFEKSCLVEADLVLTVSDACATGLAMIGQRKVEVITNGFIFPQESMELQTLDEKFSIAHIGSMSFPRNPEVLWKALSELIFSNPEIKEFLEIKLVGPVDFAVFERIEHYQLTPWLKHIPMVSHEESLQIQLKTQILLLVANNTGNVKGILTGKFFEYLAANRPILAIGEKDSNLEDAVIATTCGEFVAYDETEKAKNYLLRCFQLYQQNALKGTVTNKDQFDSRALTKKMLSLIYPNK